MTGNDDPIGVFDSGVGGLSVLREIRAALPHENLLYVADSGHLPYGSKPAEYIEQRALAVGRFLLGRGAKAIVVACNTATAAAIATLRAEFRVPVIGMEPGIKPAIALSTSRIVGVLATEGTLTSAKFRDLVGRTGEAVEVIAQACPGWVEQVERGELASPATRALVYRHTQPVLERGADTLVLGCTHYPFLCDVIADIAGPGVRIVETGTAVARQLRRRLEAERLLARRTGPGAEQFWSSGPEDVTGRSIAMLWAAAHRVQRLPADVAAAGVAGACAED
ncbi:glutamate racemase [Methylococcus geothermalis]|uniref:Glutamate racemase n=1 Tax=Methylococcus geothermalis TaxID=2681310 RepID=A0A858Q9H8_9GAMM|nr:glutamate racemase [Methylococcus geothermalis]QJD30507.1 glutamate racemase [Methylococcus geothermalis]